MSEQILSQEEVGALLSAMDKGEVDLEKDEKPVPLVEEYDLTSQRIMLRDQFGALEEVYDRFKTLLRNSLSSSLQKPIELELVSSEMATFGQFLKAFSNPTSFNLFNMEPLVGNALLTIEPKLVFSLIDCMLGGDGKPLEQIREFTQIEQRMIRKVAEEILRTLEQAWECVHSLKCSLKKVETKPGFIHAFAPNESVQVVVFSISGGEFSGKFFLCMSCLMLESIKDKISASYLRDAEFESTWSTQLIGLLRNTEVEIAAELGKTNAHTVRDLMKFQSGDIIKLNKGPHDTITVTVEAVSKYMGFPGILKGNRAVQVNELLHQNGGSNLDG